MENRAQRRQRLRLEKKDLKPVREGLTVGQLKEAEAELTDGAVVYESSRATTMGVLAHSWYALDHQREASRTTFQRVIELRKGGREMKTDQIVQQYAEAKVEIVQVESQIVELLNTIADEEGEDIALGLLGSPHTNMMNGITVRLPTAMRDRLALEASLIDDPEAEAGGGEGSDGGGEGSGAEGRDASGVDKGAETPQRQTGETENPGDSQEPGGPTA